MKNKTKSKTNYLRGYLPKFETTTTTSNATSITISNQSKKKNQ